MGVFEITMCVCAVAIAFVKVYDWVEYQLSLRQIDKEAANDG
jgi:hypothetical protein